MTDRADAALLGPVFDALDVADRIIERSLGLDVPRDWNVAFRAAVKARAKFENTLRASSSQNAALRAEVESEREARWKSEAALRMKDEAVNTLMVRLREKHGDNCEDLIP